MLLQFAATFMIALSLAVTTAATYAYGLRAAWVITEEQEPARARAPTTFIQPILVIATPVWPAEEERI